MDYNRVWGCPVVFGCDPEFFFATKSGKIVGSEKVIPSGGLPFEGRLLYDTGRGSYIQDGVQVEINPQAKGCRGNLGNEIGVAFRTLRKHLEGMDGLTVSFRSVVEVDKEELASLSEKSRILGCQPSLNIHDKAATIAVNPATFRTRSAGGHVHMGLNTHLIPHAVRLVPILDVLLGNTCVLIDRDPLAAERRKVYGRAGEYRLPKHGLEYRTLSNFWLRSYQLMSFVMGLVRLSNHVLHTTVMNDASARLGGPQRWDAEAKLLSYVDMSLIRKAINGNNRDLALKNWEGVKKFIQDHVSNYNNTTLQNDNTANFELFANLVHERGIEYWFPEDPMEHWSKVGAQNPISEPESAGRLDGNYNGIESFLARIHEKQAYADAAYEKVQNAKQV